jgi:hypothetical protein
MRRKEKSWISFPSSFKPTVPMMVDQLIIEPDLDQEERLLTYNLQPIKLINSDLLLSILKRGWRKDKMDLGHKPTINITRINSVLFINQLRSKSERIRQKQLLQQHITPVEVMQQFSTKRIFLQDQIILVICNIQLAPMTTQGLLIVTQRPVLGVLVEMEGLAQGYKEEALSKRYKILLVKDLKR